MTELSRKTQMKQDQLTTTNLVGRGRTTPEDRADTETPERVRPTLVRKEDERADTENRDEASMAAHRELTSMPLFSEGEVTELRNQWSDTQSAFVDEPRKAVETADKLVATVMQRMAEFFAHERSNLEKQWARNGEVSTEELRVALQHYRSFFDRLLKA